MDAGTGLLSSSAGVVALLALVLALLALGGVVWLLARQQRLLGQYQQLMTGTSGGNLEAVLSDHMTHLQATTDQVEELAELARRLEEKTGLSLQHVGVVRFNPFHDTGGDQSFALALTTMP